METTQKINKPERITFTTPKDVAKFTLTEQDGKLPRLQGYAITFNTLSDDRGGYFCRFIKGSAKPVNGKVFALADHDFSKPLGNTENGTLTLTEDDYGVLATIDPCPTSYSNDLIALVRRGDTAGMSFGMLGDGMVYQTKQENGMTIREFSSFQYDEISTTCIPAFTSTTLESEFVKAHEVKPIATPLRNRIGEELAEMWLKNMAL